jgi:hypothetical protein
VVASYLILGVSYFREEWNNGKSAGVQVKTHWMNCEKFFLVISKYGALLIKFSNMAKKDGKSLTTIQSLNAGVNLLF